MCEKLLVDLPKRQKTLLSSLKKEVEAAADVCPVKEATDAMEHKEQAVVIESLKDQLSCKIDSSMNCMEPGSVCEKLVAAVKAAIYGAKDQEALQAELEKLPAELTTQLCKNIFCVVKDTFPELNAKCAALMGGQCPPCPPVQV